MTTTEKNPASEGTETKGGVSLDTNNKKSSNSFDKEDEQVPEEQTTDSAGFQLDWCFQKDRNGDPNYNRFIPLRLAEHLDTVEGKYFTISPKSNIYRYTPNQGIWEEEGEAYIKKKGRTLLEEQQNTNRINETVSAIRDRNSMTLNKFLARQDKNKNTDVTATGVLNLYTKEETPFDWKKYALASIPVTYNPSKDCPQIKKFFSEITNNSKEVDGLFEAIGYCLYKDNPYQKAFLFQGDGSNGKSTLFTLIRAFLGKNSVTHITLQKLLRNRFASSLLFGKLANIAGDLPATRLIDVGDFKQMTGEDPIFSEEKHKGGKTYRSSTKHFYAANQLPPTDDDSDAFYRRLVITTLPHKFNIEIGNVDHFLINKLTTEDELSGLLNEVLKGFERLQENKKFTNEQTVDETAKRYQFLSDPYTVFIDSCVIPDCLILVICLIYRTSIYLKVLHGVSHVRYTCVVCV